MCFWIERIHLFRANSLIYYVIFLVFFTSNKKALKIFNYWMNSQFLSNYNCKFVFKIVSRWRVRSARTRSSFWAVRRRERSTSSTSSTDDSRSSTVRSEFELESFSSDIPRGLGWDKNRTLQESIFKKLANKNAINPKGTPLFQSPNYRAIWTCSYMV